MTGNGKYIILRKVNRLDEKSTKIKHLFRNLISQLFQFNVYFRFYYRQIDIELKMKRGLGNRNCKLLIQYINLLNPTNKIQSIDISFRSSYRCFSEKCKRKPTTSKEYAKNLLVRCLVPRILPAFIGLIKSLQHVTASGQLTLD